MERTVELSVLLSYYGAFLTERQQNILSQHVDQDYSLSEIAEREGISRQGVYDALRRAQAQLWDMEEKLGLVKRVFTTIKGLESIRDGIEELNVPAAQRLWLRNKALGLLKLWEDEYGV